MMPTEAQEQGYALYSSARSPIILHAPSSLGLLYASATLLQLLGDAAGEASLPNVAIRDYPDVRYRGNNWNIWAETGGWSYDRGDGAKAYERRIIRKLDMCVHYKVTQSSIYRAVWSPDGTRLATIHADGSLIVSCASTRVLVRIRRRFALDYVRESFARIRQKKRKRGKEYDANADANGD